jgi:hypothetical protein
MEVSILLLVLAVLSLVVVLIFSLLTTLTVSKMLFLLRS